MRVKDNPICFNGNKKYPEKAKKENVLMKYKFKQQKLFV